MTALHLVPSGFVPSRTMDAAFEQLQRDRDDDDLCTPAWLWAVIDSVSPIVLDPCSNPWAQQAPIMLERDHKPNGLEADWSALIGGRRGQVYANSPYGRGHLIAWAHKCATEATCGVEITQLTPVAPTTKWWKIARHTCDAMAYLDRRVAFEGGTEKTGLIDSAVFYWGPHAGRFRDTFAPLADVRVFDGARLWIGDVERPPPPPPRAPKKKKRKPLGRVAKAKKQRKRTPAKRAPSKAKPKRPGVAKVRP